MQFSINTDKPKATTDKNSKGIKSDGSSKIKDKENSFLSILESILKNNTQLTQARQRGRNDKKILMTVKILDENIQILASTMLSPQNSAFSLLKQIERIRGLLMDLKE